MVPTREENEGCILRNCLHMKLMRSPVAE